MSIGQDEITDILEHDPKSRAGTKWLTPADRMERVLEIVVEGGGPTQIKRKLRIPYHVAVELHNQAYEQVWQRVSSKRSPEVLAAIKDENVEHLQASVQACREEIDRSTERNSLNVKAVNALNGSIKQLSNMLGHNAPTLSANLNVATTLVHPADQQAFLQSEPQVREQTLRENAQRRLGHWPQPGGGASE